MTTTATDARADVDGLRAAWATLEDLSRTGGLLAWDRQTMMPSGGSEARGHAIATLARIAQERLLDPSLRERVERLEAVGLPRGSDEAAAVRVARRELEHATRVPLELTEELSRATNRAHGVWVEARAASDFARFAPELERVVELRRREADALGWIDHPYDALHDRYEPGSSKARLDRLFGPLRERLSDLVARIRTSGRDPGEAALRGSFPRTAQEAFAREVITDFGYDWARGRLDRAVHPFAQALGTGDVRVTTRYAEDDLRPALFGTMHEAGHAMYEQGIADEDDRTPLGGTASLAVHESQSRLWENLVGRSRPFWEGRYARLREAFPGAFDDVPLDDFVAQINRVAPTLIRVEADEVTYGLHVVLRYELEVALIDGSLRVRDLPEAWNEGMRESLGVVPPDDARGCLQDVHWSLGLFGYFPTYALGTMMSAQLWRAAEDAVPTLEDDLREGRFDALLDWLREHVHRAGRRHLPDELMTRATGAPLSPEPYFAYLEAKYGASYGLEERR